MKIKKICKKIFSLDTYEDMLVGFLRFFIKRSPLQLVNKKYAKHHPFVSAATSVATILVVLGAISWMFVANSRSVEASWWDDSWLYRKSITITNDNDAVEEHIQIKLLEDEDLSSDVSAGKISSDLSDLRFTDIDGNALPYWILDYTASSVDVWVKVGGLAEDQATFYMYYGNNEAQDRSSYTEVGQLLSNFGFEDTSAGTGSNIDAPSWVTDNLDATCGSAPCFDLEASKAKSGGYGYGEEYCCDACEDDPSGVGSNDGYISQTVGVGEGVDLYAQIQTRPNNIYPEQCPNWDADEENDCSGDEVCIGEDDARIVLVAYDSSDSEIEKEYGKWILGTRGEAGNLSYWGGWQKIDLEWTTPADTTSVEMRVYFADGNDDSCKSWTTVTGGNAAVYVDDAILVQRPSLTSQLDTGSLGSEERGPGPVGYWNFDEGYGSTTNDSSGQGNDGTISGGASWEAESKCVSGKCLGFDGVDGVVDAGTGDSLDLGTSDFSVSFWGKFTEVDTYEAIVTKRDSDSMDGSDPTKTGFHIQTTSSNKLRMVVADGTNENVDISSTSDGVDNNFHHFVFVADRDDKAKIYIDGKMDKESDMSNSSGDIDTTSSLKFGTSTYPLKGFVDEVKIYPYARSAAQVKRDYNAGLAGVSSSSGTAASFGSESDKSLTDGLVGHWKMDEDGWDGTSDEVVDSSSFGNHGTAVSTATTATGKFGEGGTFNGTSDYVEISTSTFSYDTFATWFKTDSSAEQVIAGGLLDDRAVVIKSGKIVASYLGNDDDIQTTNTFHDGQWHHLVVVQTGKAYPDNFEFYVDGTRQEKEEGGAYRLSGDALVGAREYNGEVSLYFDGELDDIRLYDRQFSAREAKKLYQWAPGPVGHWKFDEKIAGDAQTIYDSSGNENDGTTIDGANNSGMECDQPGKYGSACKFDGIDDYIDLGSSDFFNYEDGDITTMAWIKTAGNASERMDVLAKTTQSQFLRIDTNGTNFPFLRDEDAVQRVVYSSTSVADEQWHHVAMVNDFDVGMTVYVDGIYQGVNENVFTSTISNLGNLRIGYQDVYFDGLIDDVRIYDYARTQKQILEDMNAGHPAGGSPVAYWKFDEGFGDTAYDELGNNDGTLDAGSLGDNTDESEMWSLDGKYGRAVETDGTDDFVEIPYSSELELGNNGAISFWYKPDTLDSGTHNLISYGGVSYQNGYLLNQTSSNLAVYWMSASPTIASSNFFTIGQWHHILVSNDNGTVSLYKNGEYIESADSGGTIVNDYSTYIGARGEDLWASGGIFDEVKIYNYAMTADQVNTEFNMGKALVMGQDPSRDNDGTTVTGAAANYCIPGDDSQCDAPVLELKMDEKTGTTAYDISGNGNDGTLGDGTPGYQPSWTMGRSGGGLNFDGTDDIVNCGNPADLDITGDEITLSAWIKPHNSGAGLTRGFISKSGYSSGYRLFLGTTQKIGFQLTGSSYSFNSSAQLTIDEWSHVVGVYDGEKMNIYINGEKDSNELSRTGGLDSSSADMVFGHGSYVVGAGTSYPFNGKMDDVRVYDYARTPEQIAWDYNKGAPIAEWRFNEGSGTTVHDESGNGNDGTMTNMDAGTDWVDGRNGKALDFDGSDDHVSISDDDIFDFGTDGDFAISAWIKTAANGSEQLTIVGKDDQSGHLGRILFKVYDDTDDAIFLTAGVGNDCNGTVDVVDGQWHHVAMIADRDGSLIGYVDGVVDCTGGKSDDQDLSNSVDLQLGRSWDGTTGRRYFDGLVDEIKVYNYALTPLQIKEVYNGGAVSFR